MNDGQWQGLSMAQYNRRPGIRGSEMATYETGGVQLVHAKRTGERKPSAAMLKGSYVHALMEKTAHEWTVLSVGSRNAKVYKEAAAEIGADRIILEHEAADCVAGYQALRSDKHVMDLLLGQGTMEPSMFWRGLKIRPDWFGTDVMGRQVSANWKTVGTLHAWSRWHRDFPYAYGASAGLYGLVYDAVFGRGKVVMSFPVVCLEAPYPVQVFEISRETMRFLMDRADQAITAIMRAQESGVWKDEREAIEL